eukprot:s1179_g4.t1
MALAPWFSKVKKSEKDEVKDPPPKVMCSIYEKQMKNMKGQAVCDALQPKGETGVSNALGLQSWQALPDDGLPVLEDWVTVLEQMILAGKSMNLEPFSLEIVKGYTKSQCLLFVLMSASDTEVTAENMKLLEPLFPVRTNLDRVSIGNQNMLLSFRGSERQPPNALQMALRFSIAMQERAASGCHAASMSAEDRLRAVTSEFNETPGMLVKWQVDQVKFDGIFNLITGTSPESRDQIAAHLHVNKWHFSALNVELLKRNRWLLGAVPKGISDEFKKMMVVTPESQSLFLELIFHNFYVKTRKVRTSQRGKCRVTPAQWDSFVNFACVFSTVMKEASLLANGPDPKILKRAFLDMHRILNYCKFSFFKHQIQELRE